MRYSTAILLLVATLLLFLLCNFTRMTTTETTTTTTALRRSLQEQQQHHQQHQLLRYDRLEHVLQTQGPALSQLLRDSADNYFCPESQEKLWERYPPLDYEACPENATMNAFKFGGGLTNGLKFLLMGALLSIEQGRCFEGGSGTTYQYFQNIGFWHIHPRYQEACRQKTVDRISWEPLWEDLRVRRIESEHYDFTNTTTFGYSHPNPNVNGVSLKRDFIRRFWQLRPEYRESTCQSLQRDHHDLIHKDYIAFSVRRGDKVSEGFKFPSMEEYIMAAEPIIRSDPQKIIFVATDDCSVLSELRALRPAWTFESQCDFLLEDTSDETNNHGFVFSDEYHNMNSNQRDIHFRKFFVEIYAMALSQVFIGVSYTNVAWFVYMLRPEGLDKSTFQLLDVEHGYDPLAVW